MKVVLLAGGLGTRMSEETEFRPKPMVHIGERPILRHIMSFFSSYGHNEFIVCAGYKHEQIEEYFAPENADANDIPRAWKVTVVDTGAQTLTAGRIGRIADLIPEGESFFVTYGDSLSDVDLESLTKYHKDHGKLATMTVTQPRSRFGVVRFGSDGDRACIVNRFEEKPQGSDWVNSGYMLLEYDALKYMFCEGELGGKPLDDTPLENTPIQTLVSNQELVAFRHYGFYQPMDTVSEMNILNTLWNQNKAPWRRW